MPAKSFVAGKGLIEEEVQTYIIGTYAGLGMSIITRDAYLMLCFTAYQ